MGIFWVRSKSLQPIEKIWLRGMDLNHRPLGYEPNELPDCSTPHRYGSATASARQTLFQVPEKTPFNSL
jgi:hypothetical protein